MTDTGTGPLTEQSTARTIDTPGWHLRYHEAGSGHPVILLHGSGPGATGWSNYQPNIGPLAEHFRVLAVDMPGWGDSDPVTADNFDHVETLLQFMDALDIKTAAIVGNSMGGATAIRFATEHPDRISHLITMGTPASPRPGPFGPGGLSEGLKVLFRGYQDPSEANIRQLVQVMTYDQGKVTEELVQRRTAGAQAHPEHLAAFLQLAVQRKGPIPMWPTIEAVSAIETPTLLIHGRDDRVVHFENSLALVGTIPNSRMVLLNRCGHWAQNEHADEFNRLFTDFINNN